MLIETHAHLDYPDFAGDFDDVLRRATEAGVTRIITIGTSVESSRRAVDLAEKYPNIFAVIGVHPTYVEESGEDVITPLRELAGNPRVVAIGETGLDYHSLPSIELAKERKTTQVLTALQTSTDEQMEAEIHDGAYKSKQASLFEQQLDLAAELGLNVVIHQRDAWDDTLEIMKPYTGKLRGVFHCFGGSLEQANAVIDPRPPRLFHRDRDFQERPGRARSGRANPNLEIHGRNRLSVSRAGAVSWETLRARAHAHRGRNNRGRARHHAEGNCRSHDRDRGEVLSLPRMTIRSACLLFAVSLCLASCVAPDTRHHVIISVPQQRMALLDQRNTHRHLLRFDLQIRHR